jgi:hypothetical protein
MKENLANNNFGNNKDETMENSIKSYREELDEINKKFGSSHGEKHDVAEARVQELESLIRTAEFEPQITATRKELNDTLYRLKSRDYVHAGERSELEKKIEILEDELIEQEKRAADSTKNTENKVESEEELEETENKSEKEDRTSSLDTAEEDKDTEEKENKPEDESVPTDSSGSEVEVTGVDKDKQVVPYVDKENKPEAESVPTDSSGSVVEVTGVDKDKEVVPYIDKEEIAKKEYLRLKSDFKQTKRDLQLSIEADLENKGSLLKKFGFGRDKMSKSVQEKYDTMMKANNKYMKFSEENGFFDKIDDRLHRESEQATKELKSGLDESGITIDELRMIESEEDLTDLAQAKGLSEELIVGLLKKSYDPYLEFDIRTGIFNRHVVNPAKERLEAQSLHMPAFLSNLKNKIMAKAEKHPNVAKVGSVALKTSTALKASMVGLGFAAALVNPIAVAAGFATRYAGKKLFINKAEAKVKAFGDNSLDKFSTESFSEVDLEKMEQEYFSGINDVDKYKVRTNTVAAGVALGAAGGANAYGLNTIDSFMPSGVPDNLPAGDVPTMTEATPSATEVASNTSDLDIVNQNQPTPENLTDEAIVQPGVIEVVDKELKFNVESYKFAENDEVGELVLPELQALRDSGQLNISDRYDIEGGLNSYMWNKFSNIPPDVWQELGVVSGDPNIIKAGDFINGEALMDIMKGGSPDSVINVPNINQGSIPEVTDSIPLDDPAQSEVTNVDTVPVTSGSNPSAQVAESLDTSNSPETPAGTPSESLSTADSPKLTLERTYTMSNSYQELVTEFTKPEPIGQHLLSNLQTGINEGSIIRPFNMTIEGVDYFGDLEGYITSRLPELHPEFNPAAGEPALSKDDWLKLGVPDGDPKNILNSGDTLQTGKLLQFILSGDKSVLFPKPLSYV